MEATIATMIVAAEAGMEVAAAMKTATVPLATTTAGMGAAMITVPAASIAMPQAVMTATAAAETIAVAARNTTAVMVDVATVEMQLLREMRTVEVKATRTATIGTLVVRLRTANRLRWGALLEIVRPTWQLRICLKLLQLPI